MSNDWDLMGEEYDTPQEEVFLEETGKRSIRKVSQTKPKKTPRLKDPFDNTTSIIRLENGIPEFVLDYPFYEGTGFNEYSYILLITPNLNIVDRLKDTYLDDQRDINIKDARGSFGRLSRDLYDFKSNEHRVIITYAPTKLGGKKRIAKLPDYIERIHTEALRHKVNAALYYDFRFDFMQRNSLNAEEDADEIITQLNELVHPVIFETCETPEQISEHGKFREKLSEEFKGFSGITDLDYSSIRYHLIADAEFPKQVDDLNIKTWDQRLERRIAMEKIKGSSIVAQLEILNGYLPRKIDEVIEESRKARANIKFRTTRSPTNQK